MKTRLPKALLIAVLAAIVQPVLAEETTPQPDFSTWGTKVTPGVIVGKEQNVTISGNENLPDGLMVGAPVNDATAQYGYNKPYLKDGVDTTLTIEDVDATFVNPLYVREGAAEIKDSKILVNCKPDQVMLQVAGNNAEITFTNSSYAHYTSTVFMAVGGPDGKGTMNLVNSHVTATTLMLGHSSASSWMGTFVTNSTAASTEGGERYSGGEYTHTNRGNGDRFYGEATVNVDADSTLTMKSTLYIAEATLNVNGGKVTTAAEAPYGVVLGKIIDSHSTLNIKDGGQMISAGGFQTGDYFLNLGVDHSGATILVDGKNDKGEASTLSTTGVLDLGYGSKNAKDGVVQTSLTVSNGGKVVAGGITLGRDTDANLSKQVQVTVGADSSIEGASLNVLEGAYVANSGSMTITEDTVISGGSTKTLAGGVTNFEGNVTITGGEFATGNSQLPTVQKWRTEGPGYTERRLGASYTGEEVTGGVINFGGDASVVQIKDATFQSGGEMNFSGSSISVENASFETIAAPAKDTSWTTVSYEPQYYTNADGDYTDASGNVLADGEEPIVKQYIKTTVKNSYTSAGAMSFNGDVIAKAGSMFVATAGKMNFNGSLTAEAGSSVTNNATVTAGSLTLNGGTFTNNGELIADTIALYGGELVLGNESTLTLIVDNTAALIFGDTEVLKLATDATKVYVNLVLNSMSAYALRSASTDLILAEGNVEQVSAFYSLLDDDNVTVTYVDANGNELNDYGVQKDSDGKLVISSTSDDVVPEPTTTTLSLLALAGLAARRRRAL